MNAVETLRAAAQALLDPPWEVRGTPPLLAPLAAWLSETADNAERHIPAWERGVPMAVDQPPIMHTAEDMAALVEHHYGRALAVARAILGSSARCSCDSGGA